MKWCIPHELMGYRNDFHKFNIIILKERDERTFSIQYEVESKSPDGNFFRLTYT